MIHTENRHIGTEIPHPEALAMLERLSVVESQSMHGQLPVVWDRAEGSSVYDPWGNRWIDFTSTIFVANAGHGNPLIVDAIVNTAQKPLLHAYNYPTIERLDYLEALIEMTPAYLEKAFLVSAGTEAIEVAIKLMRMNAMALGKRRSVVVSFEGNWHGRTTGAQHLSSNVAQRAWIGHEDPEILRMPFPYPWVSEARSDPSGFFHRALQTELDARGWNLDEDVAGFMLETYQGWGAVFYPPEFVQAVEKVSRASGALLVFDEMQSGFARTGELFGYEHYGVQPDLVCCGKGASSSVPLAFVLGSGYLLDLPSMGSMSSTHSANPISCAAGLVQSRFGGVWGLVNNVASNPPMGPAAHGTDRLENFPLAQWDHDIRLGLTSAYLCSRYFGGSMAQAGAGSIVNIASDLALISPDQRMYAVGLPEGSTAPVKPVSYSVVKSGLLGLTRYLSTYWSPLPVRCNALLPGSVGGTQSPELTGELTQRIPLGRLAKPDEYQGALVFLLSDASSYMTGASLVMDGGRTAW